MNTPRPEATFGSRAVEVIKRMAKIPEKHRSYTMDGSDAKRVFAFDRQALDILVDAGLPHARTGSELLLDSVDLENVSLGTQLPSLYWNATRILTKSLRTSGPLPGSRCLVEISCACPDPGHAGACDFSLDPRFGRPAPAAEAPASPAPAAPAPAARAATAARAPASAGSFTVQAVLENDEHDFDASFAEVVREATSLAFHKIPRALISDMGFLRETRLADCRSASRHLVGVCEESGLAARPASGFFVGTPFPNAHDWFEVVVGGRSISADPFFLHTLHGWGLADAVAWPPTRSPRNVLWRLGNEHTPDFAPIRHQDTQVNYKMLARWRA